MTNSSINTTQTNLASMSSAELEALVRGVGVIPGLSPRVRDASFQQFLGVLLEPTPTGYALHKRYSHGIEQALVETREDFADVRTAVRALNEWIKILTRARPVAEKPESLHHVDLQSAARIARRQASDKGG